MYLKSDSTRYYFLVCKDVFDQSVYLEFVNSRKMEMILDLFSDGLLVVAN